MVFSFHHYDPWTMQLAQNLVVISPTREVDPATLTPEARALLPTAKYVVGARELPH